MKLAQVDILINGYPGISDTNGGLSWSTIGIVRTDDRVVLIDTGPMGARSLLTQRLKDLGLECTDVTDVVLTHLHHDHSINWPMFEAARVHVSRAELNWALELPNGTEPIPAFYAKGLAESANVSILNDHDEIAPGIRTELVPGHTPGSIVVHADTAAGRHIFLGDAAKNRAELASARVAATLDVDASLASLELIWKRWRAEPNTTVVPGHDLPLRLDGDKCRLVGERNTCLQARLGIDFDDVTVFYLS